jgi:hypothetical protein
MERALRLPLGPARTSPVNTDRLGRCSIGMDAVRRRPIIKVFGATFEWGRSILAAGQPKFESISLWQSVYELSVPERWTLNDKCRGAIVIITHRAARGRPRRPHSRSGAVGGPQPSGDRRSRRGARDRDDLGTAMLHSPSGRGLASGTSRSPFCRTSVARLASTTLPANISNPRPPWAMAWSRPNGSCSAPRNRLLTGRMRTIYSSKEHQAAHWPSGRPALNGVSGF